jgi:hypothetical protein
MWRNAPAPQPMKSHDRPEAEFSALGIKAEALPNFSQQPFPDPAYADAALALRLSSPKLRSAEIQDPFPLPETHFFRYRTLSRTTVKRTSARCV